jgi:hypothetical protein
LVAPATYKWRIAGLSGRGMFTLAVRTSMLSNTDCVWPESLLQDDLNYSAAVSLCAQWASSSPSISPYHSLPPDFLALSRGSQLGLRIRRTTDGVPLCTYPCLAKTIMTDWNQSSTMTCLLSCRACWYLHPMPSSVSVPAPFVFPLSFQLRKSPIARAPRARANSVSCGSCVVPRLRPRGKFIESRG